jgi:hypothetical protein
MKQGKGDQALINSSEVVLLSAESCKVQGLTSTTNSTRATRMFLELRIREYSIQPVYPFMQNHTPPPPLRRSSSPAPSPPPTPYPQSGHLQADLPSFLDHKLGPTPHISASPISKIQGSSLGSWEEEHLWMDLLVMQGELQRSSRRY